MPQFTPLGARVFVKRREVKSQGGIIIPETSQEMQACDGEVMAIGSDCERVTVGQHILFGRYSGSKLPRYGEDLLIMNEEDILAIVKED